MALTPQPARASTSKMRTASLEDYMKEVQARGQMKKQNWNSLRWLAKEVTKFKVPPKAGNILRGMPEDLVTRIGIGGLYMYFYDPKYKKELPYYDRFPCTFI